MALGDDYIMTAQLKTRLGVQDSSDDILFAGAIKAATAGINLECGRDFQQASGVSARRYKPTEPDLVIVDDFHTSTGLIVRSDSGDSGSYDTTIDSSDYELEPIDGIVNGLAGWPFWQIRLVSGVRFRCGRRHTVQVVAPWGWAAVPPNVTEACYVLSEDIAKLRDAPFGVGGFAEFGRIRARQNPHVMTLIQDYRRGTAHGQLLVG